MALAFSFQPLYAIQSYLRFLWTAKTRYAVHSPYVYDFATKVLPHQNSAAGEKIETLRKSLLKNPEKLTWQDFGAGYRGLTQLNQSKTVAQIAAGSGRRRRSGELLYRICKRYQPQTCLELGTNLGLSALYQLAALQGKPYRFITIEAGESLAQKAEQHLKQFGYQAEIRVQTFDQAFDELLPLPLDYVFIDGKHTYEATLAYVRRLLPHMNANSLIVLDDIYWSSGMTRAWQELATLPEVSLSIDVFTFGLLFIGRKQAKEHFTLLW